MMEAEARRLEAARKSSARNLALYLGGLGGLAVLGAISTEIAGVSTFSLGSLFGAHMALAGIAILASALEWGRERLAEGTATAAMAGGVVLTVVDLANGIWYFAPFLGVASLLCIFAVVNRYMERDEERHGARLWTS